MAGQGATSSLRRICTPAGGALLLCLVFAGNAVAASPSPDPPPLAVAPEEPNSAPAAPAPKPKPVVRQAPVVTRTVVTPAPVVTRTVETPVIVTREVPVQAAATPAPKAKPKPKPATKAKLTPKPRPKAKPRVAAVEPVLPPHDRRPVPLARFIPTAEELNRGLVALAGGGLAFVALGGAVVLLAARRQLGVA